MKKTISWLLCLTLLVAVLPGIPVSGANDAIISCQDVTAYPGQEFTVEVRVVNNPGFSYLEMTPEYSQGLTLVQVVNGSMIADFTQGKQYVWVADRDVTTDGVLMTFSFRAEQTGTYSVGFIIRTCGNYDEESVRFTVDAGEVTVVNQPVPVTGVSLNKQTLNLREGQRETLVATIVPSNADNQELIWSSSDVAVAMVSESGLVTAIGRGSAVVRVTTADGSFSASCAVNVACSHRELAEQPSKSPDCVTPGNYRYYTCCDCGQALKADGVTETTVASETIPALGHDFTERIEDAVHLVPGSGADCQHLKAYYYDCSRCEQIGTQTFIGAGIGPHIPADSWEYDSHSHWSHCELCDEILETEAHDSEMDCAVCGYTSRSAGDLDIDGVVNNKDVEYLLWHTLFPEDYPIAGNADFDGDGSVTNKDVEYLLWHTLFPSDYPI